MKKISDIFMEIIKTQYKGPIHDIYVKEFDKTTSSVMITTGVDITEFVEFFHKFRKTIENDKKIDMRLIVIDAYHQIQDLDQNDVTKVDTILISVLEVVFKLL